MPSRSKAVISGETGDVATYGCVLGEDVADLMYLVMEKGRAEAEASGVLSAEKAKVFGKVHVLKRKTAYFGKDGAEYGYSGFKRRAHAWGSGGSLGRAVLKIRDFLAKALDDEDKIDGVFDPTYALVNWYPDGTSGLGPHSDDERDLMQGAPIVSVSLGATRDMVFETKDKTDGKKTRVVVPLSSGTVVSMRPPLQSFWKHSIPVRKRVLGGRFNITFRTLAHAAPADASATS